MLWNSSIVRADVLPRRDGIYLRSDGVAQLSSFAVLLGSGEGGQHRARVQGPESRAAYHQWPAPVSRRKPGRKIVRARGAPAGADRNRPVGFQYADEIFGPGRELTDVLKGRPRGRPLRLTVG